MSTYDAPGYGTAIHDELKVGVWGEHKDGSLVFVASTENHRVVFEIFDLSSGRVIEYRDAISEDDFKRKFSWSSRDKLPSIDQPWQWHDKTPFPWDKVIAIGAQSGSRFASADDVISHAEEVRDSRRRLIGNGDTVLDKSAAQAVAEDLQLQGRELLEQEIKELVRRNISRPMRRLAREISSALSRRFGGGDDKSR